MIVKNAKALITVWVIADVPCPKSLLHPTSRGQCWIRGRGKNKTEELRSFVFSLSCMCLLEDGVRNVGGQHSEDVLILKMADGKGGERRHKATDALPNPYTIIHHRRTVQCSPVRFSSASRLPTPEAGLPWQLCAAAVTMAATAVGGGLMQAPVPAGSARHWRATGGGLAGSGFTQCHGVLQTLGLIQVPATHLGIAGQEL